MNRDTDRPVSFAHAGEILDFESVLDIVASKCVNDGARCLIAGLRPGTDADAISRALLDIEEVRGFHKARGNLPVPHTESKEWIERALDKNEVISAEGLLSIASVEKSVLEIKRLLVEDFPYPRLERVISKMVPNRDLVEDVERAIDRDGSIKDKASAHLASVRKSIGRASDELRRHVAGLSKSYGSSDFATFTGSRHVLLVPRDKCRKKEGIVHSASHSGGSLYFEPLSLVERNNSLETLLHDERVEEARILNDLTAKVSGRAEELFANIGHIEWLDALNAKAKFAEAFKCLSPAVSTEKAVRLVEARHPLLEMSLKEGPGGGSIVPLNLELAPGSRVLVITGPNAGGKTVSLKTLGLAVLMFQSGLPVPCADGTELPLFLSIHVDIGDEQSIATSLSTFTSHLKHLDRMCRQSDDGSLCLVDEIGYGTDPDEGAALAIAALERLQTKGAYVVATTHYGKVKSYALTAEGISNASMAFDENNDNPLYKLLQGTAGRSRGIETAKRLGFDPSVVSHAESLVGQDAFRLESVLSQLESSQLALEREREALRAQSEVLNRLFTSYNEKERALVDFRESHEEKIKKDVEEMALQTRKEIESIVKQIRETQAEKSVVREAHRRVKQLIKRTSEKPKPQPAAFVAVGDTVSLSPSGDPSGTVIEIGKIAAIVEIKGKKLSIKKGNLYKVASKEDNRPHGDFPVHVTAEPLESTSVDVRGREKMEAIEAVDIFLDRVVLSGVREIKIIHGVGEGVLLKAVRELLKSDSRVGEWRPGGQGEGGVGVTIVRMK